MSSQELRQIAILFYNLTYPDFCLAIKHPQDYWTEDKYSLMRTNFIEFIARVDDEFIQHIIDFCVAKEGK
jgi:hypothetical protein